MNTVGEKVAFLRGLAEGLEITDQTREGKVLLHIIDVLGSVGEALAQSRDAHDELSQFVDSIDSDLMALENALHDGGAEDEGEKDGVFLSPRADMESLAGDAGVLEVVCPVCNAQLSLSAESFLSEDDPRCPHCQALILDVNEDE